MPDPIATEPVGERPWRRYPFALVENDAELGFPECEGDQGAESNTYYVAGRLHGRASGHRWAFLVIFAFLSRRDHQSALRYLNTRVRSEIERLAEPYRGPVLAIVEDTADVLLRWWVRP